MTPQGPPPNDYFVMSILTLFCCFMPLSLVALIKSIEVCQYHLCSLSIDSYIHVHACTVMVLCTLSLSQTRGHNDRGEYHAAMVSSRQARLFNRLSILVGVLIWLGVFIMCQIGWIVPLALILALPPNNTTTPAPQIT